MASCSRYEGPGTSDKRWLHADERGSVVAVSNASGNTIATNSYDEFGIPAATNIGRFQYTGQKWISELGLYDYKARLYSPTLGRFLQTDPIGYGDGMNWYNYVGSDPVNGRDPTGLVGDIIVTGMCNPCDGPGIIQCYFNRGLGLSIVDFGFAPAPASDPGAGGVRTDGASLVAAARAPKKPKPGAPPLKPKPKPAPADDKEKTCKLFNQASKLGTVIGFTSIFNQKSIVNALRFIGPKLVADMVPGPGEVLAVAQISATALGAAAEIGSLILDCE